MKTTLFIFILAVLTLPNAFAAPEWKPYDDFEGDLDAIDETPGQIPDLGTKWVQFVPEKRLEMGIKGGVFQMKVKSPGGAIRVSSLFSDGSRATSSVFSLP